MGSLRTLRLDNVLSRDEMLDLVCDLADSCMEIYDCRGGRGNLWAAEDGAHKILDQLSKACIALEVRTQHRFKRSKADKILIELRLAVHELGYVNRSYTEEGDIISECETLLRKIHKVLSKKI